MKAVALLIPFIYLYQPFHSQGWKFLVRRKAGGSFAWDENGVKPPDVSVQTGNLFFEVKDLLVALSFMKHEK